MTGTVTIQGDTVPATILNEVPNKHHECGEPINRVQLTASVTATAKDQSGKDQTITRVYAGQVREMCLKCSGWKEAE